MRPFFLNGICGDVTTDTRTDSGLISNKTGADVRVTGYIVRYKPGLEKVLFGLEIPKLKQEPIFQGDTPVALIGSPWDKPIGPVKLPGEGFILEKGQDAKIQIERFAGAPVVTEGDIQVSLLCVPAK